MSRPPDDREDGFLGRWSRLKRRGGENAALAPATDAPAEVAEDTTAAEALPEKSDAEILEELGLPEPESLKPGDDFSAFMKAAVPDRLRRRALRMLWRSNPMLANLDELVDYGEDFTDAAKVVANLQTGWQIGRGFRPLEEDAPAATDDQPASAAEGDGEGEGEGEDADAAPAPEGATGDEASEPVATADAAGKAPPVLSAEADALRHGVAIGPQPVAADMAMAGDAATDPVADAAANGASRAGEGAGSAAVARRRIRFSV